ncbi:hypothetical protein QZH41_019710 [Actinostola sp. cb2023]|nr:hypothetical protein QZH41_019710 [Actinostola sp. cb2023]
MQESFKIYPPLYLVAALLRKEKFEYFTKRFFQDILQSSLAISVNGSGFIAGSCLMRQEDGLKKGALKSLIRFFIGTTRPEDIDDLTERRIGDPQAYCRIGQQLSFDCVKYSFKAFTVGYVLQLLTHLPKAFKKPSSIPRILSSSESLQCGLFLGSYVGIFKVVEYIMAWHRNKQDSINTMVAGGLSGLSMLFYRSSTTALYLASKIGEILYQRGIKQGLVPTIPYATIWIYTICTAMTFHAASFEVEAVRPSYWRYLNQITHKRFCEINRQRLGDVFDMDCAKYFPPDDIYMSMRR